MAKKKKLKTRKSRSLPSGVPADAIKWFSRFLRNMDESGRAVALRKAKAETDCRALLAGLTTDWIIPPNGFQWDSPQPPEDRFKLTVFIKPKRKTGGSGNPPIPAPKQPPPSM